MISSEVQRTLVKSPPELWAELSDPSALARHLGELGEIRITRTEPEKLVEWEAGGTTGTVAIKASGWGTKVTLTVSRELPPVTDSEPASEPPTGETGTPEAEAIETEVRDTPAELEQPTITAAERFAHDDPEPLLGTRLESSSGAIGADDEHEERSVANVYETAPEPEAETEPVLAAEPAAEPRRGFLARMFGRRRAKAELATATTEDAEATIAEEIAEADFVPPPPDPERLPEPEPPIEAVVPSEAVAPSAEPEALPQPPATPAVDLAAELRRAEESAAEETRAVLTAVLDRLGSAHHRPFSRS